MSIFYFCKMLLFFLFSVFSSFFFSESSNVTQMACESISSVTQQSQDLYSVALSSGVMEL